MKKLMYALLFLLSLSMLSACGGKSSKHSSEEAARILDSIRQAAIADSLNQIQQSSKSGRGVKAASVDTMQMVVDNRGNVVGRYVRTNGTTYTVSVQDDYDVPKAGNRIVTFRAKNGQGILYTKRTHVNIRQQPNTESSVLTQISFKKGHTPETYPCLGKVNDWYKIIVKGKEGYVRQDLVIWDGMDSF